MSAYSPASSVGWLDLDAAASERVGTLLRSLEEPGTLDPLGLGSVRDAFSIDAQPRHVHDPDAASVLHVPAVDLRAARGAAGAARLSSPGGCATARRASSIACATSGRTRASSATPQAETSSACRARPTGAGLGSWGLRRLDLSLAEYGKRAAALGRLRPDRDDDGNVTTRVGVDVGADARAARRTSSTPRSASTSVASEAQLLVDHIRQRHPGSLLAAMCGAPELAADADFPWDLPDGAVA